MFNFAYCLIIPKVWLQSLCLRVSDSLSLFMILIWCFDFQILKVDYMQKPKSVGKKQ